MAGLFLVLTERHEAARGLPSLHLPLQDCTKKIPILHIGNDMQRGVATFAAAGIAPVPAQWRIDAPLNLPPR
ncbi:MAG: hypothetical protein ACE369_10910 [Roseovarius sp.]